MDAEDATNGCCRYLASEGAETEELDLLRQHYLSWWPLAVAALEVVLDLADRTDLDDRR